MSDKKILLIEDDAQMLSACKRVLEDNFPHHTIITATNAIEGVNAAKDPSIVAVITDNVMPFRQGSELKECAADICAMIWRSAPHLKPGPLYIYSSEVREKDRLSLPRITANQGTFIHISADKSTGEFEKIVADMKARLAPAHLPPDHRPPATPAAGEIAR